MLSSDSETIHKNRMQQVNNSDYLLVLPFVINTKTMAKILASNHLWLIGKLWNNKMALGDIYKSWLIHSHEKIREEIFNRKFYRWRNEINEYYNVKIEISAGLYHIENQSEIEKSSLKKWLFDTASVYNDLFDSISLKDRILPENVPSGNANLTKIIGAMNGNRVIHFGYKKYSGNAEQIEKYNLHPYCIKLFEKRWYVMGECPTRKGDMRTFSLDMIQDIDITDETFNLPDSFDAEDHYKDFYGIVTGDNDPFTEIKIKVNAKRANYFRTLPLHHSQKELSENDDKDYAYFTYELCPGNDFYQALLHHGPLVEVLAPESARNKMKELIREMGKNYK
jgi:hypothetical protein